MMTVKEVTMSCASYVTEMRDKVYIYLYLTDRYLFLYLYLSRTIDTTYIPTLIVDQYLYPFLISTRLWKYAKRLRSWESIITAISWVIMGPKYKKPILPSIFESFRNSLQEGISYLYWPTMDHSARVSSSSVLSLCLIWNWWSIYLSIYLLFFIYLI